MILTKWLIMATAKGTVGPTVASGPLYEYGTNSYGQLGNNSTFAGPKLTPVQVGTLSWSQVSIGNGNVIAIRSDGTLWAWGLNNVGQLGNSDVSLAHRSNPVQIGSATNWTKVSTKESTVYAINSTGALYGWGLNDQGQLGLNTLATFPTVPITFTQISSGLSHNVGIDTTGRLFTWGINNNGQLGDNSTIYRSSPVQIGTSSWSSVAASASTTFAIRSDGTFWAWGSNNGGILGDGTGSNKSSPTQIGAFTSWKFVGASQYNTYALNVNNLLYTWGTNSSYQLGDGSSTYRSFPMQITTLGDDVSTRSYATATGQTQKSWTLLSMGFANGAGIQSDGTLWTWGDNTAGQLGIGTSPSVMPWTNYPIKIGTSSWTSVSVGNSYMLAIRNDSTLFSWGLNNAGQLGVFSGTNTNFSSPVLIGLSSDATNYNSYAFSGNEQLLCMLQLNISILSPMTVEGWVFFNNTTQTSTICSSNDVQGNPGITPWRLYYESGNLKFIWRDPSGTDYGLTIPYTFNLYTWYHVAGVSYGYSTTTFSTSASVFVNGVNIGSGSILGGGWYGSNDLGITYIGSGLNGYLSSIRLTIGQALYTNNFTPSTSPLTTTSQGAVASNVYILTAQTTFGGNFYSANTNGSPVAFINSGIPKIVANNPFSSSLSSTVVTSWSQVTAGGSFSFATTTNNVLYGWGLNASGQVGDSSIVNRSSPVVVGKTITQGSGSTLFSGDYTSYLRLPASTTSLYLTAAFTWECWVYLTQPGNYYHVYGNITGIGGSGANNSYCFAVGTDQIRMIYYVFPNYPNITTASGTGVTINTWTHIAITRDASNNFYIFKNGTSLSITNNSFTTSLSFNTTNPVYIGSNSSWSNYNIWPVTWLVWPGYISNLRVITGTALYTSNFTPPTSPLTAISGTQLLTCQGNKFGDNSSNNIATTIFGTPQLSELNPFNSTSPTYTSFTKISAGGTFSAAILNDGTLYAWGFNTQGQLGLNDSVHRSSPVQIGTSSWSQVSAGGSHALAIRTDGYLYGWGLNTTGQVGDSSIVSRSSPVQIGTSSWSLISAGNSFSLAGRIDGGLFSWGANESGQLGLSILAHRSSPVQVSAGPSGISNASWSVISAASTHAGAIATNAGLYNSSIYAWGIGLQGQLGRVRLDSVSTPSFVKTISDSWTTVSAGTGSAGSTGHMLGMVSGYPNYLYGWGYNADGQLGTNDILTRSYPVNVNSAGISWSQVSAGYETTFARDINNSLWAWGSNANYNLGDGTNINRSAPVQINPPIPNQQQLNSYFTATGQSSSIKSWTQISEGYTASYAIRSDGALFGWGFNTQGQLGLNDLVHRSSPVQIGTSSWSKVGAGGSHVIAIRSDGRLFAWGLNNAGQLGDFSSTNRSSPVQIGTSSWSSVSAGNSHSIGLTSNNTMYAWGLNSNGQLGDSTKSNKSSPVLIGVTPNTGYASVLFNGTSNYIATINPSNLNVSNSDFTIECWIFLTSNTGVTQTGLFNVGPAGSTNNRGYGAQINNASGSITFIYTTPTVTTVTFGSTPSSGSWTHIAFVRSSNAITCYVNGAVSGTASQSMNVTVTNINSTDYFGLGGWDNSGNGLTGRFWFPGYISNFRIVVGTAIYTSTFTPSTSPLSAVTNTQLLVCQNATFKDNSSNGYLIFNNGSGATAVNDSPFTPSFTTGSYTQISAGLSHSTAIRSDGLLYSWGTNASGQLGDYTLIDKISPVPVGITNTATGYYSVQWTGGSGTGYYLYTIPSANYAWGTGDFTVEGWFYLVPYSTPTTNRVVTNRLNNGTAAGSWSFNLTQSTFSFTEVNTSEPVIATYSGPAIRTQEWLHCAAVRIGTAFNLYINGVSVASATNSTNFSYSSDNLAFGWSDDASNNNWSGYMSNVRLVKGVGVYTGNFTVPSSPLSSTQSSGTNINAVTGSQTSLLVFQSPAIWKDTSTYTLALSITGTALTYGSQFNPFGFNGTNQSYSQVSSGNAYTLALTNTKLLYSWGTNNNGELGDNTVISKGYPNYISGAGDNGYNSVYFGGADGLDVSSAPGLNLASGIFTMECWFYATGQGTGTRYLFTKMNTLFGTGYGLGLTSVVNFYRSGGTVGIAGTTLINPFTWYHVAVSGNISTGIKLFVNGNQEGSTLSSSTAITTVLNSDFVIASYNQGSTSFIGYVSNLRVLNGTALYTSNFTPPTSPLTTTSGGATNCVLLTCQSSTFIDNSVNNYSLVGLSKPSVSGLNPFSFTGSNYSSWNLVSANDGYSFGIRNNGNLYGWGYNTNNNLGLIIDTASRSSPVQIGTQGGISAWTNVSGGASTSSTIGLDNYYGLYAWGNNANGTIGNNTIVASNSPIVIASYKVSFTVVSANNWNSNQFTGAIRSDGVLYTWGYNGNGQLGTSDIQHRSFPTQIGSFSWTNVSAGGNSTTGTLNNNNYAWGFNTNGELGVSDIIHRSSPVQIGTNIYVVSPVQIGTSSWSNISSGASHAVAIRIDGTLWAWGYNAFAQLGTLDLLNRSSPVQISTSSWSVVSAGASHTLALNISGMLYGWGAIVGGSQGGYFI